MNEGIIDMGDAVPSTGDMLTIEGNYTSAGGTLRLDTMLGADGAPSDILVVSGGLASGSTEIVINNAGGAGAGTVANGIPVVQVANGGATAAGAFTLAAPVGVGVYEYLLFRGGMDGTNPDDWFLRSMLVAPAPTLADPDPVPPPSPAPPTPGAIPAPPIDVAGTLVVPLIRPEIAVYASAPPAALFLALESLSTFHDRRAGHEDRLEAFWLRAYGMTTSQSWSSDAAPRFDGMVAGLQAGADLATFGTGEHATTFGVMAGVGSMTGDVHGSALGRTHRCRCVGEPRGRIATDARPADRA